MTTFNVLSAEFLHETNTFCKLPTNSASFAERGLLWGEDAIAARKDNNTELAGFLDAARGNCRSTQTYAACLRRGKCIIGNKILVHRNIH